MERPAPQNEIILHDWYARVRLLSLDVALGAYLSGLMVARLLNVAMPLAWYVVLPLAVWVIYTLDHLLDARRLGAHAHTARHLFHYHYFQPLAVAVVAMAIVCLGLALAYLGTSGLLFGAGMGAGVLVHLLLVKVVGDRTSPFLIKEMGVALIYSAGIWGMPLLANGLEWQEILYFGQFLLLALVNLIVFSYFEHAVDEQDGHTSFVRAIGPGPARLLGAALLLIALVPVVLGQVPVAYGLVMGLMALVLGLLLLFEPWFARYERYRAFGDGAFLLPGLYLLFS